MVLSVGLMGLLLSGCASGGNGTTASGGIEPTAEAKPAGAAIFETQCAGCHTGGGNMMNPDKPVQGSAKLASLATFTAFVRDPGNAMPAFPADVISDADLAELHGYLQKTYGKKAH